MKDHAQYAEMLALYAIGALDDNQECPDLEAHLRTCPECRQELAALRGDAALFALSAVGPAPPQGARQRLQAAISNQPRKAPAREGMVIGVLRPRWLAFVPIAATLVLAIFSLLLLRSNSRLVTRVERAQAQVNELEKQIKDNQQLIALLKAPDAVHMTLVSVHTQPQPQIKTIYSPNMGRLMMVASNMNPLPSHKAYELWLLPADGGAPMPCGLFWPDASGNAMMHHPLSATGIQAQGFAVTVEPENGSPAPTGPIQMKNAG